MFLEEVEGLLMMEPKVLFPLVMTSFIHQTVEETLTKELENCAFLMELFAKTVRFFSTRYLYSHKLLITNTFKVHNQYENGGGGVGCT